MKNAMRVLEDFDTNEDSDLECRYDYEQVYGKACENVVGVLPIPLTMLGPFTLNG